MGGGVGRLYPTGGVVGRPYPTGGAVGRPCPALLHNEAGQQGWTKLVLNAGSKDPLMCLTKPVVSLVKGTPVAHARYPPESDWFLGMLLFLGYAESQEAIPDCGL